MFHDVSFFLSTSRALHSDLQVVGESPPDGTSDAGPQPDCASQGQAGAQHAQSTSKPHATHTRNTPTPKIRKKVFVQQAHRMRKHVK